MTGSEFRAALKAAHLSQRAFAERAGVHEVTVSKWVTGAAAIPAWVAWLCEFLPAETANRR